MPSTNSTAAQIAMHLVTYTLRIFKVATSITAVLHNVMDLKTTNDEIRNLASEATIATFLAAVQSQIIALSYQDDSTKGKVAANALGFAGVLLDVSAACFALLASTVLQRHVAIIELQLGAIEDASPDQIKRILHDYGTNPGNSVSSDIIRRVRAKVQKRLDKLKKADTQAVTSDVQYKGLVGSLELDIESIQKSFTAVQAMVPIATAAASSLLYGVICFFASVLCLAIATQPRVVWIISAVICAYVVLFYPLVQVERVLQPRIMHDLESMLEHVKARATVE